MKRPFSDDDIDRLIATPYMPPKPLTIPAILLLILFFPLGIYYLMRKNTPEYMLSLCETDEERDALFAYLKTPPDVYKPSQGKSFLQKYYLSPLSQQPHKNLFVHNVYRAGTAGYNAIYEIKR